MDAPVITTLGDFVDAAFVTAIYPDKGKDTTYPFLGLYGECGEVCEKIKKLIRDDSGELHIDRATAIRKELGDVMWYVAANMQTHDLPIERSTYLVAIDAAAKEGIHPRPVIDLPHEMAHTALVMSDYATAMRSAYVIEDRDRTILMGRHLEAIIAAVARIARMIGTDILTVCEHNLTKLYDRRERGVLTGDGDDR